MITQDQDISKIHCLLKANLFLVCTGMPTTKGDRSCCAYQEYLGWELKEKYTLMIKILMIKIYIKSKSKESY